MSAVDSPAAAEEAKSIVLEAVRDSSARAMGAVVAVEGRGVAIDVNGSEPIEPNSVQKVYTAGAALIELGDQHHFHTEIRTCGRIEVGGVLPGDLAFVASGDPTLSQAGLETFVWRRLLHRGPPGGRLARRRRQSLRPSPQRGGLADLLYARIWRSLIGICPRQQQVA